MKTATVITTGKRYKMLEKPLLTGLDQWALQTTWVRTAWNALNLFSAQSTFPNTTFILTSFCYLKS